jgi:hypothetical protein
MLVLRLEHVTPGTMVYVATSRDPSDVDNILTSHSSDELMAVVDAMCVTLARVSQLHSKGLGSDELAIGLAPSPNNLVLHQGEAFYVDFYPPRFRTTSMGTRLDDSEVIMDGFRKFDETRRRYLLRYFYTRSGMWMAWLAHVVALAEENNEVSYKQKNIGALIIERVLFLLADLRLSGCASLLERHVGNSEFMLLRKQLKQYRAWYLQTYSVELEQQNTPLTFMEDALVNRRDWSVRVATP